MINQELAFLQQRIQQLETAFASASQALKQQYKLWFNSRRRTAALKELKHQPNWLKKSDHRQHTTPALPTTEQFISSIIEMMPVAIFVKDAVDLRFVLWNRSAEELVGLSSDEILGKTDYDLLPVAQADFFTARDQEVLSSKKILEIPEEVITTKQGETRILHIKKTPILDLHGQPKYLLVVREDITERRRTEIALIESEAKFRSLVENANDAIFSLNREGILTYISPNFTEKFGYESTEIIGKLFINLIHPDDLITYQDFLHQIIKTRQKQAGLEIRSKHQDSSYYWILCNISPIKDASDVVIGFQGVARDITARKQVEQTLQESEAQLKKQTLELEKTLQELQHTQSRLIHGEKMSSLGQLVAGVAHEINNPINFISGNLNYANQYIKDLIELLHLYQKNYPNPPEEIQKIIKNIDLDFLLYDLIKLLSSMRIGTERISQIVASLRIFSRLDEAELKATNIHEGIDSTLMILDHRLRAKPYLFPIKVIKEYGNLPKIECYAGQLNQVFMNILANAIDALEESLISCPLSPEIRVYTQMLTPEEIIIRIIDNGPGMSETVHKRLFDPFYTTKPVGKGTGMGLSISYQIITERHRGSLKCISSPGQGAEFIIQIPVRQSEN
ncbi:PAS domain-containing sensor histidine kinase [Fortiea contorta]|uniref:PAS domain-containing sensor histidine kinase n=1 Tax=Fortiea contorta TaxID=1892405 RepID=UPI000344D9E8|nr:PAS domain S-box protein [Fortiea contorta]